jgi:PAS domain-containing protein
VPLLILNPDLKVISANGQFYRTFRSTREETLNRSLFDLGNGQWDIPALRKVLERIIPDDTSFEAFEVEHNFPTIGSKSMILNIRQIRREGERLGVILIAIEDTTPQCRMEKELRATIEELERQVAELKASAPGRA